MNAGQETATNPEPCVVGVDFGTLSGRAVVVRVRDGAELGTAEHAYRHAVLDRNFRTVRDCPRTGPSRSRRTTSTCSATRCRQRSRQPVSAPSK